MMVKINNYSRSLGADGGGRALTPSQRRWGIILGCVIFNTIVIVCVKKSSVAPRLPPSATTEKRACSSFEHSDYARNTMSIGDVQSTEPVPPLDPSITLVPLKAGAYHPCDPEGMTEKRGSTMPLHVSCLTTILVDQDENEISSALPTSPELLTQLCQAWQEGWQEQVEQFHHGKEEATAMTCVQTPHSLGVLVRRSTDTSSSSWSPVFPFEAPTVLVAATAATRRTHSLSLPAGAAAELEQAIQSPPKNARIVERKTVNMHGYYQPVSKTHDAYRGLNGNKGNALWQHAATRMINPATTLLVMDNFYDQQLQKTSGTIVLPKEAPGPMLIAPPAPVASAFVIASANALDLEEEGMFTGLFNGLYDRMHRAQVPVVVIGLGIQASFKFLDKVIGNIESLTASNKNNSSMTGAAVYEAVREKKNQVQLFDDQTRTMKEFEQWQTAPGRNNIGVRGELTKAVCQNSGIHKCVSMGCPTLTISRDPNLGRSMQQNWARLQQDLRSSTEPGAPKKHLKIGLAMPHATGSDYWYLSHLLLRIAQSTQHDVVLNVQSFYDESGLNGVAAKSHDASIRALGENNKLRYAAYNNSEAWLEAASHLDLLFSTRIHGSMVGIANAVPTVIVNTDHRILELVDAMHLPHISLQEALALSKKYKTTAASNSTEPASDIDYRINNMLLEILELARYKDFDQFERNRRDKIRHWHEMLTATGVEMDPALVYIAKGQEEWIMEKE